MKFSSSGRGAVNIGYKLAADAELSMAIYDLKGKRVAVSPNRFQSAGEHKFAFKGAKGFYIVEAKIKNKSGETKHTERFFVR